MRRPPASIRSPKRRSRRAWRPFCRTALRSSSPTACRRCGPRTASSCWITAGSSRKAATMACCSRRGITLRDRKSTRLNSSHVAISYRSPPFPYTTLFRSTASIDPLTEAQIQEGLETVLQDRTAIVIAHRLSTVRAADRIIVLDHGRIIEEGSHDGLLQQAGHYATLYDTYFRHQSASYDPAMSRSG